MAVISGTKRLRTSWTHSRFWNSKRNKPIDCQLLERLDPLFEALAKEIELEGLHLGEDGYVCLSPNQGFIFISSRKTNPSFRSANSAD